MQRLFWNVVIPGRDEVASPESITPDGASSARHVVMDSGLAAARRPGM